MLTSSPPRFVAPASAVLVVGLAALEVTATLYAGFAKLALIAGALFAVMTMAIAWLSLRWQSETVATRICVIGSAAAGAVSLMTATALLRAWVGQNAVIDQALPQAMNNLLSSALLGGPPGLVAGALFALPVRRVHRLSRARAIEATDHAVRTAGAWLAVVSAGCAALGLTAFHSLESSVLFHRGLLALMAAAAATSTAAAVVAHRRITARRRWFERIRSGDEPGWTIQPRSSLSDDLDGLSPLFLSGGTANALLVRHQPLAGGGVYRRSSDLIQVASLQLPEGLAVLSFSVPDTEQR